MVERILEVGLKLKNELSLLNFIGNKKELIEANSSKNKWEILIK